MSPSNFPKTSQIAEAQEIGPRKDKVRLHLSKTKVFAHLVDFIVVEVDRA